MNQVFCCAQVVEEPKEVYVSSTMTACKAKILLPPTGHKKVATPLDLTLFGKSSPRFREAGKVGQAVYIHGAKLRHDLESRTHSLEGGIVTVVDPSTFPLFNSIILGGRSIRDIDTNDPRHAKTLDSGLMIVNFSLSVNSGRKGDSDLFNCTAINGADDRLKLAELIINFVSKGTGLTVLGKISSDSWTDQTTGTKKLATKIILNQLTLGPKPSDGPKEITPQTSMAPDTAVKSLWNTPAAVEDSWAAPLPEPTAEPVAIAAEQPAQAAPEAIPELPWNDANQPF